MSSDREGKEARQETGVKKRPRGGNLVQSCRGPLQTYKSHLQAVPSGTRELSILPSSHWWHCKFLGPFGSLCTEAKAREVWEHHFNGDAGENMQVAVVHENRKGLEKIWVGTENICYSGLKATRIEAWCKENNHTSLRVCRFNNYIFSHVTSN